MKRMIKIASSTIVAGATEKIIIQIASFLNVNLSSFIPCLPSLTVGLLTLTHNA